MVRGGTGWAIFFEHGAEMLDNRWYQDWLEQADSQVVPPTRW
jgi:3-phenylpropionate/cinnamic acid dioxygenase small subunit